MTECDFCFHDAQCVMTWVNSPGHGNGAGLQGAAMCDGCAETTWYKLGNYPAARETVTIYPINTPGAVAAMDALAESQVQP